MNSKSETFRDNTKHNKEKMFQETVNAVTKYAEAIDCLLASLQVIEDDFERQKIRDKISRYLQRAEVLKQQLRPTKSLSPNSKSISVSRENSQLSENGSQFGEDFLQLWTDVPQVETSDSKIVRNCSLKHAESNAQHVQQTRSLSARS